MIYKEVRTRRRQIPNEDIPNDVELILSLIPSPTRPSVSEEDDADTDEIVREATVLLLRLTYAKANSQLESIDQELQLLRSMPSPPSPPAQKSPGDRGRDDPEDIWKLDAPGRDNGQPLMDANGKVEQFQR